MKQAVNVEGRFFPTKHFKVGVNLAQVWFGVLDDCSSVN
jgi:hypothetical protein